MAQSVNLSAGILTSATLTIGQQNQKLDFNLLTIGTINYGDAALETVVSLSIGHLFKRHSIKQSSMFYGYEFFTLAGIGKNMNLLGTALASQTSVLIFNAANKSNFNGLGFGFKKEYLSGNLSHFNQKIGEIMFRFSKAQHAFDVTFLNDFKFGRIFNGEGTDFGSTGALKIGFTKIISASQIYRAGAALELFTPKPDYSKTPKNPLNSDDGRKNVWYTQSPFAKLFYANLYAFGTYQTENYSAAIKAGVNSEKLGAYVQNTLHDGSGLNPRFPWNTKAKDKVVLELSNSILNSKRYEN